MGWDERRLENNPNQFLKETIEFHSLEDNPNADRAVTCDS